MENRQYNSSNRERESSRNNNSSSLAKAEQQHRHSLEKTAQITYRIGKICGLIYNLAFLYFIFSLIEKNKSDLALKLFIANALLIAIFLISQSLKGRKFSKNNFNKNRTPQRNKPSLRK